MTRKIALFLLPALGVAVLAQTPKKVAPPKASGVAQTLMTLEETWVDALQKGDTAALDSVLADTYVDTDEQGHRTDKQAVLSALKSGDLKFESVKVRDMQVHTYGYAAVVTGIGDQRGRFKGQALIPKVAFTDTFIQQSGRWRAVASHRCATAGTAEQ